MNLMETGPMNEEKLYRHPRLNVVAGAAYWPILGFYTYANADYVGGGYHGVDELLVLGMAKTSANDWRVIAWAAEERQRRVEERSRAAALSNEAQAISNLAASIHTNTDSAFLERVLSQLSERTRYAVLAQLKK